MVSFGERLKRTRENKKMSIDDVSRATKIAPRMLSSDILTSEAFENAIRVLHAISGSTKNRLSAITTPPPEASYLRSSQKTRNYALLRNEKKKSGRGVLDPTVSLGG